MSKKTEEMLEKNFKNRYEQVINAELYKVMPRSVLWALVVRLLRNAGWDFHQIDQAILDTWKDLWDAHYVRVEPPEAGLLATSWLDPRDQIAVIYASNVWGCTMSTAGEIIFTSVKAEKIPTTMGEPEFKEWVDMKLRVWRATAEQKKTTPPLLMTGRS
jgi:hypothetical protein